MSAPGGFPFPGTPGAMPGGVPGAPASPFGAAPMMPPGGAPAQSLAQDFVLVIPPDPAWEPMEFSDVLEKDGYYCIKITSDTAKVINDKLQVIVTGEIQDADTVGRKVSRFMPDPRNTKGNTWFIWRGLMLSIWGTLDVARQGVTYRPGMFTGHMAYVKTAAYADKDGTGHRTGIDAWSTKKEWEEATAANKHRWPARVTAAPGGGVGALPAGLPAGMPGAAGFPGLGGALPPQPGGAGMPTGPAAAPATTPQPPAAPMQQQAPAQFPPSGPQPNALAPMTAAPAPAAAPAGFGFPPAPAFAAPAPQPMAPPPVAPQPPTAATAVAGFPGMPGFPPPPTA